MKEVNEITKDTINKIISIANKVFVISCVGLFAIWTKPSMTDYYQELANRHYDFAGQLQMLPIMLAALFF